MKSSQALTYEVTVVPSPADGSVFLADQTTVVTPGVYTQAEIQGLVFRPAAEQSGTTFFEFQVVDDGGTAGGGEDTQHHSIQIVVNPVNDAPVALGDSFTTEQDTAYTATLNLNDLLQNDTDVEGDALTVDTSPVIGPANGTLSLNGDGTFIYTPDAGYFGDDSFVYQVSDGNGGLAQATVQITVTDVNDAPTITLTNTTTSLLENAVDGGSVRVADIVVSDDAVGDETLSLTGADAGLFEIVGNELHVRADAVLDSRRPQIS